MVTAPQGSLQMSASFYDSRSAGSASASYDPAKVKTTSSSAKHQLGEEAGKSVLPSVAALKQSKRIETGPQVQWSPFTS